MVSARFGKLVKDTSGAALMEFTVVASVLFTVLFGILEFTHLFYQWNAATKAVQVGTRLAAVSAPVWQEIAGLTGTENNNDADVGTLLDNTHGYDYAVTCLGSTTSCNQLRDNISGNQGYTYDPVAMATLVFGRSGPPCGDAPGTYLGMCDIFNRVDVQNVQITYEHTFVGYGSRPGGLVPTITLQLVDLNFEFIFLDDLLGLNQVAIPGLRTTMIAEDMRTAAPNFGGGNGGNAGNGNGGNGNGNGGNGNGNGGNGNGNGNGNN